MGAICSLTITLFIGIGSIIQGNAGKLSNQKLPLRTDGCYLNTTLTSYRAPVITTSYSPRINTAWKDVEYSGINNLFGISYLWLPAITVVSAIVFGLIFSFAINAFWKRSAPVKAKYMTPIILRMWKRLLGEERLQGWVEFEETTEKSNSLQSSRIWSSSAGSLKIDEPVKQVITKNSSLKATIRAFLFQNLTFPIYLRTWS